MVSNIVDDTATHKAPSSSICRCKLLSFFTLGIVKLAHKPEIVGMYLHSLHAKCGRDRPRPESAEPSADDPADVHIGIRVGLPARGVVRHLGALAAEVLLASV